VVTIQGKNCLCKNKQKDSIKFFYMKMEFSRKLILKICSNTRTRNCIQLDYYSVTNCFWKL